MRKNLLLEKAVRLLLSSFAFLILLLSVNGYGQISESFESGLPSSYDTTPTTRTLSSGSWQVNQVIAGTTGVNTGTKSAQLQSATGSQLTTPTLTGGVGTISFYVTASTTSGAYQVKISTDNGTTWSQVTGSPFTIGTTKTLKTITVNNPNVNKIQIYRTGATIYIDDFSTTLAPGLTAPTLTTAANATVDAPFDVTFTDDATWRGAITGVTVGGTALTAGYSVSSGKITFTPSASVPANLLQSSGTKSIVINATGYSGATVSQTIGVGAPAKLAMNTQPAAPSTNGGALATQPKVNIVDQYGNTTTSTASVTAAVGAGTWTLGGTTSVAAVSGTSTFSGLTATSAAAVTGATITFSSGYLTPVTSSTFNIPTPPPANDDCSGAINLTVNAAAVSGTFAGATPMTGASKNDVFFMFTPSVTGSYTITINGFSVASDKDFYVYSVCPNTYSTTTNVVVKGATTSTSSETAKATFTAGTSYKILVQDYGSGGGAFNISVTSPIITGGTTAAPFTTTYGTASAAQTFAVSGSNLTANLVATAPTGFEVSADGTTYGNTATFTQTSGSASGTLSIRLKANAAVTGNYNAQNIVLSSTGATSVNITTAASGNSVSTKALTITANNRTKTYGTTLTLGTSEFTSNGLANSETIGSVTLSAAGAASTATTAVGTYPITPSAATGGTFTASNYAITYVDGTLTINKADQTITFGSLGSKTYGDAAFDLAGTSSSGLALTYSSSNTDVATVSGNTVTIVGAGSTTITASQAGDDNHNAATSVDQVLTINKKSLTITGLSAESKIFDGNDNATLTGTPVLNGVVGSDDVSLTGTPTATFASSSVGQNITVNVTGYSLTGANAGDYEIQPLSLSADIIATTPTLFVNETLSALTTTYGTPSTTTSFTVSGQSLTEEITITAPSGFEVSSTSSTTGFANEISIPHVSGSVAATTIYVRLSSAAKPVNSPFSGDIVIKSTGATTLTVATSTSTVSKKELTVTGLTGEDKTYDGTTTATVLGTASLVGLINSDDVSVDGTHVFTFADANAGTDKPITASGFTLNGLDKDNYTLAQPTSLTATITKANQTVVAIESTVTKTYGDATYSIATTASSGLAVTYTSSNTAVATVAANGTVTIVGGGTASLTASQSGNGNYNAAPSVTQELTVDKANQTITAITATMTKSYGDATYSIATTASSGLAVTYASSNTAVATVAANGTVTIVGVGSTTLTASQSGNGNYNAATSVTQELTVGKGNQTITLASTATKTTADAPYTLTQNASSGLVITYASSNPAVATISGNTVTIVGAGTTTITANQAGNENYNAAPEATQTLTVTLPPKVILKWNTYGNSGTETTEDSSFKVDGLSNSTLNYVGSTVTPAGNSNRFGGNNWAIGSLSTTKYIQFTVTPADGFTFTPTSFDFIWDFSSSGPKSVTLRSSVDNYTSDIGTITNMSASTSVFKTISISGINDVVAPVTFRLYGYDATSASGTGGFDVGSNIDNVILKGFVNLLPPVITSSLTASGKVGTSFNYNITASNTPSSYSATGLPTGLSINATTGLISGTPTVAGNFDVTIGATNPTGTGTNTLVLTIAKGDQTITFGQLSAKTYGDASFALTGTSSSGLGLTYSSSDTNVATISGNTVTIVGAGSTTITASQAGDDNYNAATSIEQELIVDKANQTITFEPLSDKLDSVGTFTLSATASSGLNVTYTSSNTSVLTIAGNVATVLAPGVTTITASQAGDDNYNAATDVSQDQKIVDSTITVWDGTAWSNGEPTSSLKAILDGDYDGSSFESQTLTVNTGKTLTVNSFVKTGNVTNNGNIIVANNANFLQIGSFTSGDGASFKVRKDTKAVKRLAYMNWSSPMANSSQTLKQFSYGKNANGTAQSSTGTLDNRFYTYNNNAYVLTTPSGTFTKGQGYLIRTPNDFTTTPQIFHAQFEGTIPNAGTITYDHSSLQGNFILLGNPYPSAISYDDFMIQNTNTTGTVYVWNSQVEMVNNQYAGTIYNTFTSAGANPANSLDAYIPVGQGFFVQRTNNDPFVFTDAMRRTTEVGVTSKSSTVSKNRFWLELASPSGAKPQMLLGFFPGTNKGIDKGYDAILLDATTETLYSTVEDKKLIIDAHGGFDEADEFSLSANLTTGGNYTISLLQKEGIFSNGQKIYLKDNLTGAVTDLTTDKYEFTETTGLKSNRFTLQFKPSGVLGTQDLAKEELNIISVGKEVRIKAGQNVATVEIYDLTGKKLIKVQPHQRETVINLSTEGMIVVKVTLQNGREKSKKLIIK